MEKGLIHVYHGDGKGKTTACVGAAVRAAGRGLRVVFLQFMKGAESGEVGVLEKIPGITVLRNEKDLGFYPAMTQEEKECMRRMHDENLKKASDLVSQGSCDLLALDEATYAYAYELADRDILERLIAGKPEGLELILTGQRPPELFLKYADYITEMRKIRHPYDARVEARKGIEF